MWGFELAVMAIMIAFNSVLAAYEIALASVSLSGLSLLVTEQKKGATAAVYMKRNMEGSLAGIQLGITLVGAIAAATGGASAEEQLAPLYQQWFGASPGMAEFLAIATVVAPLTIVTIIFGELIPKVFALRHKDWVCLTLSPIMLWFVKAVWPIVWFLEAAVRALMSWGERRFHRDTPKSEKSEAIELQELRASVLFARTSRLIGPQEERIILGAAGLTARPVSEVMLPADAISMLHVDGKVVDALVSAHLDMHTRFPLTEKPGDPQAIVGYVNFKDIVAHMRLAPHGHSLRKISRAIPSLADSTAVSACLERLIREHVHIALVRDSQGRVVGMVTLEDLLEELVGDIEDEYDNLPVHVAASGQGWVVGGGVSPGKLRHVTGIELPPLEGDGPIRHVNDWVCRQLPEPLQGGETAERDGVRAIVRKIRRHKVLEAQVEKVPRGV